MKMWRIWIIEEPMSRSLYLDWILESTLSRVDLLIERLVSREKCHISASLVCHREKIKLDEGEIWSLSSFLLYVYVPDFTAAGIWVSRN